MANIRYGPLVSGIQGTVGGVTFSRNQTGSFARAWKMPCDRRTKRQSERRANTIAVSQAWTALAEGTRLAWAALAAAPPEIDHDPWGTIRYLSGYQWFQRINLRRLGSGEGIHDDPPSPPIPPIIPWHYASYTNNGDGTMSCPISPVTGTWNPLYWVIVHIRPVARIASPKAPKPGVVVWAANPGAVTSFDIGLNVVAAFGPLPIGWAIWTEVLWQDYQGLRSGSHVRQDYVAGP